MSESCTLVIKGKHREKRVDSTVKEDRFQEGDGGHAKRNYMGELGASMRG